MMTHRERIMAVLNHKEPDRIPVDLGSTSSTTITVKAHERLRAYLGLPSEPPPTLYAKRAFTVIPDETILRRFDVDARPLLLGSPDGRPDREVSDHSLVDEWGVTWARSEAGPSINTDGPFCRLGDPTLQDLEEFSWPDPADAGRYRGLRERARDVHEKADYATVLYLGVGVVHQCQYLRGYGQWLEDLLIHPAFAEGLMDRVVEIWTQIVDRALKACGEFVDLVMYPDDMATQRAPLFSPELYRRLIKPRHRRMNEVVKRHGKPIIYHCCGSVYAFLPDLLDVGIDALNPIQVSAAEMDPKRLKREFGQDLTFWGGIDTQKMLPFGTPEEVREEVKRRIDDLAEGGGYILCAVHNIQSEVPPENIVAMYEAALEYGQYGR